MSVAQVSHDVRCQQTRRSPEVHLVEELATDHGDGLDYVRALGFRRKRGKVEFFVEQEIPQAGSRLAPSSADLEWRAYPPGVE